MKFCYRDRKLEGKSRSCSKFHNSEAYEKSLSVDRQKDIPRVPWFYYLNFMNSFRRVDRG